MSANQLICNLCLTVNRWTLIDINIGNYGITLLRCQNMYMGFYIQAEYHDQMA